MVLLNLFGSNDDDKIFEPDTKWWNKAGLLYTVNEDATSITVHQPPNNGVYIIDEDIP